MLHIIGAVFLVGGTTGIAWMLCREQNQRLEYLKSIKQIFQILRNEVMYAKASLPEICRRLSERSMAPFDQCFWEMYQEFNKNNGRSFEVIWKSKITDGIKGLPLESKEKQILLDFPDSLGFRDEKGQAEGIERYIEETDQCIISLEEELKSKNKVTMCFGIMSGLLMVILLI